MGVAARPQRASEHQQDSSGEESIERCLDSKEAKKDLKFFNHRCKQQKSARYMSSARPTRNMATDIRGAIGQYKDLGSGP